MKWHPCELCVETKACCDLEETESLQSGISGLGPEVCKSASSVVSELSHAFILHGVNMSPIPSLVSFLPSYHVTIILQLVFYPPGGGGQLVSPIASLCFLLKTFCPLDFFFFGKHLIKLEEDVVMMATLRILFMWESAAKVFSKTLKLSA